jgi:hypothetical protein
MQTTQGLNLFKLFIIIVVIVGGVWYINKNKNENFAITTPNILPPISKVIGYGYNSINVNRFNAINNQMRLNKLNTRVNKLLENIQNTYDGSKKPLTNQLKFY